MSERDESVPATLTMAEAANLLMQGSQSAEPEQSEVETQEVDSAPSEGAEPTADLEAESEDEVESGSEEEVAEGAEEDGDTEEVDPDEVEDVFTVKVDGEEVELTPQQLIDAYQTRKASDKRFKEAAELRSQVEQATVALEARSKQYEQGLQAVDLLMKQYEQQQPTQEQLQQLQKDDPAEYARVIAEQVQRQQQYQALQQEQANLRQVNLQNEEAKIKQLIPEWNDADVRARESQAVMASLEQYGFNPAEIEVLSSDSRGVALLRKAALYDQIQAAKPLAKKKVRKAPRMVKSGTPKSPKQSNNDARVKAMARLSKTGSIKDAVAALMAKN